MISPLIYSTLRDLDYERHFSDQQFLYEDSNTWLQDASGSPLSTPRSSGEPSQRGSIGMETSSQSTFISSEGQRYRGMDYEPSTSLIGPAVEMNSSHHHHHHTGYSTPLCHSHTYESSQMSSYAQMDASIENRLSSASPFSDGAVSISAESPPGSSDHAYRRIGVHIDQEMVDASIEMCQIYPAKVYRCLWPGCHKMFRRKCNARVHTQSHLSPTKQYECMTCHEKFSSEGTAKRHRDNQAKSFSCSFCNKKFARKDYRNLHERQRRCGEFYRQP